MSFNPTRPFGKSNKTTRTPPPPTTTVATGTGSTQSLTGSQQLPGGGPPSTTGSRSRSPSPARVSVTTPSTPVTSRTVVTKGSVTVPSSPYLTRSATKVGGIASLLGVNTTPTTATSTVVNPQVTTVSGTNPKATVENSPVGAVVSKPSKVTTRLTGSTMTTQESLAQGKTGATQSAKSLIVSKGHCFRSFGYQTRSIKKLLEKLEDVDDPDDVSPKEKRQILQVYKKLKDLVEQHNDLTTTLLTADDVTDVQAAEATGQSEDVIKEFNSIEEEMIKRIGDDLSIPELGKLQINPTIESMAMGASFQPPILFNPSSPAKPDLPVTRRYTGSDPPLRKKNKEEQGMEFMIKMFANQFKLSEQVPMFDGKSSFMFVAFRASWEHADRVFEEQGLSEYQRLCRLRTVLKGEPLSLIKSLPPLDASYQAALEILDKVYASTDMSLKQVMDLMAQLPHMGTTYASVRVFYCELTAVLNGMATCGLSGDSMGRALFYQNILPKLNGRTTTEFAKLSYFRRDPTTPLGHTCSIEDLMELIYQQMSILQITGQYRSESAKIPKKVAKGRKGDIKQEGLESQEGEVKLFATNTSQGKEKREWQSTGSKGQKRDMSQFKCNLCENTGHYLKDCSTIKGLVANEILKKVTQKGLCKLCFSNQHKTKDCTKKDSLKCKKCSKPHNTLLHLTQTGKGKGDGNQEGKFGPKVKIINYMGNKTLEYGSPITGLLEARLYYGNPNWKNRPYKKVVLFMDSGSTASLITKDLVASLKLPSKPVSNYDPSVTGVNGTRIEGVELDHIFGLSLGNMATGKTLNYTVDAYEIPVIDDSIEPTRVDPSQFDHLKNLNFAIKLPQTEVVKVDVLIGQPFYAMLLKGAPIKAEGIDIPHPIAQDSELGIFLQGASSLEVQRQKARKLRHQMINKKLLKHLRNRNRLRLQAPAPLIPAPPLPASSVPRESVVWIQNLQEEGTHQESLEHMTQEEAVREMELNGPASVQKVFIWNILGEQEEVYLRICTQHPCNCSRSHPYPPFSPRSRSPESHYDY